MTDAQQTALIEICLRYHVTFRSTDYQPAFDLPDGWVSGWVGGVEHSDKGEKVNPDSVIYHARLVVDNWHDDYSPSELGNAIEGLRYELDVRKHVTIFVGCDPDGRISS